jgi:hypothetical protein
VIAFTAQVWTWNADKGSWHFVTVPEQQSLELRAESFASGRGFGSVKVEACIGDLAWRTSVFPQKQDAYLLPLKAAVRRSAGVGAGDEVAVTLSPI